MWPRHALPSEVRTVRYDRSHDASPVFPSYAGRGTVDGVGARGSDAETEWQRARELFSVARRITVLTGAGMSTDSGIPDFRGPNGMWTKDPAAQRFSDINSYVSNPELRRLAWQRRASHPAWQAHPNPAHTAITELSESGRLAALLTQNIDELHQQAGMPADDVIELHGSLFRTVCLSCGAGGLMSDAIKRVTAGEPDPACELCGGILKSATVSFGQSLDERVLRRSQVATLDCDLFLAAGTSLTVSPAATFAELAVKAGADLVICNAEPTPYDELAASVLRGPLSEVLPALAAVPQAEHRRPLRTWADPSTWC